MKSVGDAGRCGIRAGKVIVEVGLGGLEGVRGVGHGCCRRIRVSACHYAENRVIIEAKKIGKCAVEYWLTL